MDLQRSAQYVAGVGPVIAQALEKVGVLTVRDLLWYVPFRYIDASQPQPIANLKNGDEAVIQAGIDSVAEKRTARKHMAIIEAKLSDETGTIVAVWFNQKYLITSLKTDSTKVLVGKVVMDWQNRRLAMQSPLILVKPEIISVYHETRGLTSALLRRVIAPLIKQVDILIDPLPQAIMDKYKLISRSQSIVNLHTPASQEDIILAHRRLGFEELLILALKVRSVKDKQIKNAKPIAVPVELIKDFVASLPFKLTASQRKAAWEVVKDMDSNQPMQRLLMGDVGSGKTVVGAIACLSAIKSGSQAVWLAPTEVLASQHYKTLTRLFKTFGMSVGLLTGSQKLADLETNQLIVGTHALLQEHISFRKLGLVIVDEQHRFGVAQRARLKDISVTPPHFLSMTATPIPRTLALTLYGDLEISVLDELPPTRQRIITQVVALTDRKKVYALVKKELESGRQAFVVTPLIDEVISTTQLFDLDRKSAMQEYEKLKKDIFPEFSIGLLHGRLSVKEKQSVMREFNDGKIQLLVSTAVIEVGIDIPNATVMLIEDAGRFGLAQLHQFRGRVGRGDYQSYCFLLSEDSGHKTLERLRALEKYHSGFELAEVDLRLRGPGSLIGLKQSGLPDLKFASLTDTLAITQAREAANWLMEQGLSQALVEEITLITKTSHFE